MATKKDFGDDRIVDRDYDVEQRGNPHGAADTEREVNDGLMSAAERRAMLRNEWTQQALPTPPRLKGFHLCWLSTTNSADTIHRRLKLGYVLVKKEEMPEFKVEKAQSGDYASYITCNEMLLAKLPEAIYQDIMATFGHDMPMEEEASIRNQIESRKEQLNNQAGREVIKNANDGGPSGLDQLGRQVNAPRFTP